MARSFTGASTDIVDCGTGGGVGASSPWSVAMWAYPTSNATHFVIAKRSGWGAGQNQFGLFIRVNTFNLAVQHDSSSLDFSSTVSLNVWQHIGAACDGTSSFGYVNGVASTAAAAFLSGTGTNQQLTIGNNVAAGNSAFAGRIADVAVWNVKLTTSEFVGMYNGARPYMIRRASLMNYWPLDGIQSPEPDLSGTQSNGTLTGTTSVAGPPVTTFTRWRPRNVDVAAAPSFIPAWAQQTNLPVLGTGVY